MKKHSRQSMNLTPFSELSRYKRRDAFIQLRSKIKRHRHSENFYGWSRLTEPGRSAFFNQDVQVYFLGLDGHTIWNACVSTASRQYWNIVSDIASNKACELRPDRDFNFRDRFIPVYDPSGRLKHYSMREDEPHPEFGDRTRLDWMCDYESELIKSDTGNTAPVFEEFRIEPGFEYGTGLDATLDVPDITADALEAMIVRWRALGEKPWRSDTPVPHTRLPIDTFLNLAKTQESHKL